MSLISTTQMLSSGSRITLRKNLPLPVDRKYSPARFAPVTPMLTQGRGVSSKKGFISATSSAVRR